MAKIETRLREWAATLWDRELDDEDKSNLFDDLTQAADEIESLMEDLEIERKKHEWVSVKDRLPEKHRASYLCLTNGGYCHEVRWTNNVFGLRSLDDEWEWSVFDTSQYAKVTHWMPLPDLPKGEEE